MALLFQNHIGSFTQRKNTINGKIYKDDPAIMMWDLFNEPRCPGEQGAKKRSHICMSCAS